MSGGTLLRLQRRHFHHQRQRRRANQALTLPSGGATTDMLRLSSNGRHPERHPLHQQLGPNDTLNLAYGGLLRNNVLGGSLIGNQTIPGILTAGGGSTGGTTELVIYNANAANTTGDGRRRRAPAAA